MHKRILPTPARPSPGKQILSCEVARRLACAVLCGVVGMMPGAAQAQDAATPSAAATIQVKQPGTVSGTIVDADGDAVAGAQVTLAGSGMVTRTASADAEGYFVFLDVPPGLFNLTVSFAGFATAIKPVTVHDAENVATPDVVLAVASMSTDVDVSPAAQYALAEEEMHTEEHQRLGGIVPNFYVTYDWHAPPMTVGQKYRLALRATVDPANFALAGAFAGVEQAKNSFSGYGQGASGYGKRYGAAMADGTVGTILGGAFFPSLLRQDPRYFYKGTGSIFSRAIYALSTAVICRGDNGKWQPNYSSVLGDVAAGAVSNTYYPASDRNGVATTIEIGVLNAVEDGIGNLLQEFVFRHITPGSKP
jgi:hypothetical protein